MAYKYGLHYHSNLLIINYISSDQMTKCNSSLFNPTPGGGVFCRPTKKMTNTPKNIDPKKPKLCDFSYISMANPRIPFKGLKMAKGLL